MINAKKKEPKIKFGQIDSYILIPIIGGIIKICYRYLLLHTDSSFINHPFVFSAYSSLGMCLAFIRFIKEPSLDELMEEPEDKEKKQIVKRGKFVYICITILLDFIQTVMSTFFYTKTKLNLWNFDIIILGIFSRIILKISLNRHQLVSIASIFILSLIINFIILKTEQDSYFNILAFVNQIIYYLQVVIHKLIIELHLKYASMKEYLTYFCIYYFYQYFQILKYQKNIVIFLMIIF